MTHYWCILLKKHKFCWKSWKYEQKLLSKVAIESVLQKKCSLKQLFLEVSSWICVETDPWKILEKYLWRGSIWLKTTICNFTKSLILHRYFSTVFSVDVEQLFFIKTPRGCFCSLKWRYNNMVIMKTQ